MSQAFATRGGYHGAGGGGASVQTPTQYPPFGQAQQQSAALTYMPRQNRRGNSYRGSQPTGYSTPQNRSASSGAGGYGASNRFANVNTAPPQPMSAINQEWVEAEKELFPNGPPTFAAKPAPAVVEKETEVLPPNAYGRAPGLPSANQTAFASIGGGANRSIDPNASSLAAKFQQPCVPPNTPFYVEKLAKEQDRLESLARGLDSAAAGIGGPQISQLRNSAVNPDWHSAESALKESHPTPNFGGNVTSTHFAPPKTPSAGATAMTTPAAVAGGGGVTSSPYCGGSIVIQNAARNGSLTDTDTATAPGVCCATANALGSSGNAKHTVVDGEVVKQLIEINKTISDAYAKMIGILNKVVRESN